MVVDAVVEKSARANLSLWSSWEIVALSRSNKSAGEQRYQNKDLIGVKL